MLATVRGITLMTLSIHRRDRIRTSIAFNFLAERFDKGCVIDDQRGERSRENYNLVQLDYLLCL